MSFFMPRSLSMLKSAEDNTGREIDVKIVKYDINDGVLVSRKHLLDIRNSANEEKAKKLLEGDLVVKCKIDKIVNFGIFVTVDDVTGIIRYSELSHKGNVNPSESFKAGDEIEAKLLRFDEKRKILELSIKAVLDNPWDNIDDQIKVGDIVSATVANIQNYGVFVNLKGKDLDGLLHISEISWDRGLKNPGDKLTLGQELELKVIDINKEKEQLKCSLKQLSEKPFTKFITKYDIGDKVSGKIVHMTDFGAFIHIDFMDCLLLNVDCSWDKGDTCKSLFKVGEEIQVTIATIDKENEKVSLSKKSLMSSPVDKFAETYNVGDKITGTLANIKDFGIFVNIKNLMDIFIPTKDIQPLKVAELKIGQEIESIIVDINVQNSKVRCSIKEPSEENSRGGFDGNMKSFGDDSKTTLGDVMRIRKVK
jgi:small subunit ribosomal protein S1